MIRSVDSIFQYLHLRAPLQALEGQSFGFLRYANARIQAHLLSKEDRERIGNGRYPWRKVGIGGVYRFLTIKKLEEVLEVKKSRLGIVRARAVNDTTRRLIKGGGAGLYIWHKHNTTLIIDFSQCLDYPYFGK
jgi:hypothetical protein